MTPVGLTAGWIAASRALETESATPLFNHPYARELAGAPGFAMMSITRSAMGMANNSGPELYLSIRTRFLDDALLAAVGESSITQTVILAAGMDTRAFRLNWPAGMTMDRRTVRADLAKPWIQHLLDAGFDPTRPAAILAEGLLMYLDE